MPRTPADATPGADAPDTTRRPAGRRERLRRRTWQELQTAATAELQEQGAAGLSLRAVARRMGMSAPGLYRYVDSREALLTVLITAGYHDLADHLRAALGADAPHATDDPDATDGPHATDVPHTTDVLHTTDVPHVAGADADVADRLRAVARAYRHWAVTHTRQFALLFGEPIPGYEAPPDGPTTEAMTRVGLALAQPLVEAWHRGRLRPHPALGDPALAAPLAPMAAVGDDLPPAVLAQLLLAWGRLHGQVSLEAFGHHAWLFPDGCERLFRAELEAMLADLGIVDRSA